MTDILDRRYDLGGKFAAITGGADGIGRASARLLAELGASVAILDRDVDRADTLAAELSATGAAAIALPVDVGDEAQLEATFAELGQRFGRLDVLVNNAGMAVRASADSISLADWNRVVAVNLTGMFLAARLAARLMAPSGGAIVNTASIMGLSGGIYPNVAYQTTKGGVVNMTRALALEWVKDNIRVNAVAPTFVNTGFIAPITGDPGKLGAVLDATPMHRLAEPEEVADAIVFLASSAASMITGVTLPVDGGFLAR
jgi:NAD(P)-dependent dehydrogenase (short-subunit alcohol dehydrogenase family)